MTVSPLRSTKPVRTIVFSFDDAYAMYFSVILLSLADHNDPDVLYDLVVFHDGLTKNTMDRLRHLVPDGFSLRFFDIGDCARQYFRDLGPKVSDPQWNIAVFYDLLVPFLMPEYKRVLYCDSDMVFTEDPGELFSMSFEDRPLIVVRDSLNASAQRFPDNAFIRKQLAFLDTYTGIRDLRTYFNTGVVMFNIPAIDKDLWLEKIRTALSFPVLPAVDQDVLNYVVQGNARFAPERFNLQAQMLGYMKEDGSEEVSAFLEEARSPVIIHYASFEKPWYYPECPLSTYFWQYAERSPFYRELLQRSIRILREKDNLNSDKYRIASVLAQKLSCRQQARFQRAEKRHRRLYLLEKRLEDIASVQKLSFSLGSGIRRKERSVDISAAEGCTVAYTTDGRNPGPEDNSRKDHVRLRLKARRPGYLVRHAAQMRYPGYSEFSVRHHRSLPAALVVRAAAVQNGDIGPVQTKIYFPDIDFASVYPGCLVVSITADPRDLLDYDRGILTPGAAYDAWKETPESSEILTGKKLWLFESNITQRGKAWERPCLLQIYDGDDVPAAELEAGIRVTGKTSRSMAQQSFNVYFRKKYGSRFLDYELFEGTPQYRSFRLRAGGNNTIFLKFKDAMLQELASCICPGIARVRPAVLFLNGEYWGPYLLSEKITRWMIRDRYGLDEDQVIIIKEESLDAGCADDLLLYQKLISFADKDMTDPAVWEDFCRIMDVRSFAACSAVRIYIGDADWKPDANTILWRTRDRSFNDGKWQMILFDVGYSSGLYRGSVKTAVDTDHFRIALENNPLFASAMRSETFRALFLEYLQKAGKECYEYTNVSRTMDRWLAVWKPLMADCYKRFGDTHVLWESTVTDTLAFFRDRYDFIMPIVERYK